MRKKILSLAEKFSLTQNSNTKYFPPDTGNRCKIARLPRTEETDNNLIPISFSPGDPAPNQGLCDQKYKLPAGSAAQLSSLALLAPDRQGPKYEEVINTKELEENVNAAFKEVGDLGRVQEGADSGRPGLQYLALCLFLSQVEI